MGAFDERPPVVLPDPTDQEAATVFRKRWGWETHEQVYLKGTMTVADQEYVSNHYVRSTKKGDLITEAGTGRYALLDCMILDWTFLQGNGQKAVVNPQNIRRLPASYSTPILEKLDELAASLTEEEENDFLTGVNGHIVESSNPESLSLLKS